MCFDSKDQAKEYFDKLAAKLSMERILSQGVPKVITGVGDNVGVVHEYQHV
jgi:hypothetical protein